LNDTGMLGDKRVIFPHSPILHYEFSSWIDKTTIKTIHGNEMVSYSELIVFRYVAVVALTRNDDVQNRFDERFREKNKSARDNLER